MSKLKFPSLTAFCFVLLAAGTGLDIWFAPHRDVRTAPVFDEFNVDHFTAEFVDNYQAATDKYLAEDGDSKIVTMSGTISDIDTNLRGDIVIELRGERPEAGARFTLLEDQKTAAAKLKTGDAVKLTGVVSAGAEFDKDLNRYLDAILEQAYF